MSWPGEIYLRNARVGQHMQISKCSKLNKGQKPHNHLHRHIKKHLKNFHDKTLVVGWIVSPQKVCSKPNPRYLWVWLYLETGYCRWHLLRWGHIRAGHTINPMWHTGRTPCDNRGRDWSDVSTSQGMLAATGSRKRQGTDSPLELLEEAWLPTPQFSLGETDFRLPASRTVNEYVSVV